MSRADRCPHDLVVRARAGALAPSEQRALDRHLNVQGCALCRMSAGLAQALGPLPEIDAEDRALAARLVARAFTPRMVALAPGAAAPRADDGAGRTRDSSGARRSRRTPRWRWFAAAAALALVASAASASAWRFVARSAAARRAVVHEAAREPSASRAARRAAPPGDLPAHAPPPPSPSPPPPEAAALPSPRSLTPSLAPAWPRARRQQPEPPPGSSAAELFRAANEMRHGRRVGEAIGLYRALQAGFPSSPEARLSHLSLGDLLLAGGDDRAAIVELDAYLGGPGAPLAEEALVKKARALERLERPTQEQETWRELLARFPSSGYAWRARQRLARLEGDRP